jgi:hypothetical protein
MPSFSTSDIIALVAVIVSGITTITTIVFGYYTNRSNNRAKLREIAFEKRLDAFQNLFKALSIANAQIQRYVLFRSVFPSKYDIERGKEAGLGIYSKEDFISIEQGFMRCKSVFEKHTMQLGFICRLRLTRLHRYTWTKYYTSRLNSKISICSRGSWESALT